MLKICGLLLLDSKGIMQSGVIVRHLVLPGCRKDSIEILHSLADEFGTESFILSLMSQYTPNGHLDDTPRINRRTTAFEYNSVIDAALKLGFHNTYMQEKSSATSEYTPPFDLTGI